MKKGPAYYVVMFLALTGLFGILAIGLMNVWKFGYRALAGSADQKANLKSLQTAADELAKPDFDAKTATVTVTG